MLCCLKHYFKMGPPATMGSVIRGEVFRKYLQLPMWPKPIINKISTKYAEIYPPPSENRYKIKISGLVLGS